MSSNELGQCNTEDSILIPLDNRPKRFQAARQRCCYQFRIVFHQSLLLCASISMSYQPHKRLAQIIEKLAMSRNSVPDRWQRLSVGQAMVPHNRIVYR